MSSSRDISSALQRVSLSTNTPSPEDVSGSLRILQQLYTRFKSLKCREPTCRSAIPIVSVKDHIKTWLAGAQASFPAQLSGVHCKRCRKYTCMGCRSKPVLNKRNTSTSVAIVNNCCDQGRLFGIWVLLCRFDEVELELHRRATQNASKKVADPEGNKGKGLGYNNISQSPYDSDCVDFHKQDDLTDKLMAQLLQVLTAFIPVTDSSSLFDRQPPAELFALFRPSMLFDRVVALMRNGSISDMTKRSALYRSVLTFVTVVAKHASFIKIPKEKRPEKKRSPGLEALGESSRRGQLVVDKTPSGMSASLLTAGYATYKQAKAFVRLSSKSSMAREAQNAENKESMSLCRKIIEFYDVVLKTSPNAKIGGRSKDPWNVFEESQRVTFSDEVLSSHHFFDKWSKFTQSTPGRMTALGKEIASLTTRLPPGIFAKIAEKRMDVMKILITGAEGSPYAGGLFTFDLYLPATWPIDPPELQCVLDEGIDRSMGYFSFEYRLNPHIYPNGHVCLSLINTWDALPSERWQPHKSTLLSVFVSVQAMLLGCKHPTEHSPGAYSADPETILYTHNAQCKTVYYAMLYWLTSEKAKRGIWGEIAKTYWRAKGAEVVRSLRRSAVEGF